MQSGLADNDYADYNTRYEPGKVTSSLWQYTVYIYYPIIKEYIREIERVASNFHKG